MEDLKKYDNQDFDEYCITCKNCYLCLDNETFRCKNKSSYAGSNEDKKIDKPEISYCSSWERRIEPIELRSIK